MIPESYSYPTPNQAPVSSAYPDLTISVLGNAAVPRALRDLEEYPDCLKPLGPIAPSHLYTRGWTRKAPTVGDILADDDDIASRYSNNFISIRNPMRYGADNTDNLYTVEDLSEADVIYDLDHKMRGAEKLLEEYLTTKPKNKKTIMAAIKSARSLRQNLVFMGSGEIDEAATGLAQYWHDRLRSGRELFIAASEGESSQYIAARVLEKLGTVFDSAGEYKNKVFPIFTGKIHSTSPYFKERIQRNGLILVDDWVISGQQMKRIVSDLRNSLSLTKYNLEVNYMCATDEVVHKGLKDVPVRAYFTRPKSVSLGELSDQPSLTGVHCSPDYGAESAVTAIYAFLYQAAQRMNYPSYQNYPSPIIFHPSKPYSPTSRNGDIIIYRRSPDAFSELVAQEHLATAQYADRFQNSILSN